MQVHGPLYSSLCTVDFFRFRFPNWRPVDEIGEGVDTVWRYQRY